MPQDYSHLKLSALNIDEYQDIVLNALPFFRENGKEKPRYPIPTLFQAAAFTERFFMIKIRHERATPPTILESRVPPPIHFIGGRVN